MKLDEVKLPGYYWTRTNSLMAWELIRKIGIDKEGIPYEVRSGTTFLPETQFNGPIEPPKE